MTNRFAVRRPRINSS